MSYPSDFADLLSSLLAEQDLSAAWLARRLAVTGSTVSRWLSGYSRPGTLEDTARIATVLGLDEAARRHLIEAAGYAYFAPSPLSARPAAPAAPPAPLPTLTLPPFMAPPLPPQGLIGRETLLAQLITLLRLDAPQESNVPPLALRGIGGTGKSTLISALARLELCQRHFPDGVFWVTLGPTPALAPLLEGWARALGLEESGPISLDQLRAALYRRRALLLVDDVWEVAHGRTFALAGPCCRTLYTTQVPAVAHALATRERTLRVGMLHPEESLALLGRLVPDVVAQDDASARHLCAQVDHLPLAITLAGRLLANEADVPARMQRLMRALVEQAAMRLQLCEEEGGDWEEEEARVPLQKMLELSVGRLPVAVQQRFAALAQVEGGARRWTMAEAAQAWGCGLREAEATTAQLINGGLVERQEDGRYGMHALLGDYAALLWQQGTGEARPSKRGRWLAARESRLPPSPFL